MKHISTLLYLCITLSSIHIFAILFYSRSQDRKVIAQVQDRAAAMAIGTNVYVPRSMDLAGEPVPLHRQDVREALKKELIVNTYLHSHTIQILRKAPQYFSTIEPILQEYGIPEDFKYIAVIESRLEPLAVSPAGAVGIWQFMKGTAQEYGLEVNQEVDERYHLEKATRAAAAYLKKAYDKFGSWTMAAASYNAGFHMLGKQMDIQQEQEYYNLLLGEETERYVFRILALKQILNHPELYKFDVPEVLPVEKVKKTEVKGRVKNWAGFAREQGITYKTLKRFNPWLRKNELRNPHHKTYEIAIPEEKQNYQ